MFWIRHCLALMVVFFGGMIVSTHAQQPKTININLSGSIGPASLLRSKTVQEELKLSEQQIEKSTAWAEDWSEENRKAMQAKIKELFAANNLETIQTELAKFQTEQNTAAYKELANLLKQDQLKRLKQIDFQVSGLQAFEQIEVQTELKLKEEQTDKIRELLQTMNTDMKELRTEFGITGPMVKLDSEKSKEYNQKLNTLNKTVKEKMEAILTAEQRKTLETLSGKPVDVAKVKQERGQLIPTKKLDD